MKKGKLLVGAVLLCIMGLTGCGNDYHADESTVFVEKKGTVVTTDVENFPEDTYNKEELEEYINGIISEYNQENGDKSVVLDSLTVEEGVAEMIISYATGEDYAKFTEKTFYSGSVAEALAAGYTFEGDFIDVSNGKTCSKESVTEDGTLKVAVIQGETAIQVNGTIVYYSAGIAKLENKNTLSVFVKEAEETETAESTEGTEEIATESTEVQEVMGTEAGEDTVSDDELLTGEESIVFDFGEDEEEQIEKADEIYTYVIYKEK